MRLTDKPSQAHATRIRPALAPFAGGVMASPLEHPASIRQNIRVIPVHFISECPFGLWPRRSRYLHCQRTPWIAHPEREPCFPLGIGVPAVLFIKENILNPSTLSRADLVRELLAPTFRDFIQTTPHMGEHETAFEGAAANDCALNRKLDAARELLLRDLHTQMCMGSVMNSPQALRDWLRLHCANLEHEVFLVLYLTAQHQLIEAVELFRGTLTQTSVYPRELVKGALARNAAAVVIAHNHPSGHAEPSHADEHLTQTLKSALSLVDVRVLDHLVVAGSQVVSFAEKGLL